MQSVVGAASKADASVKAEVHEKQLRKACQEFGSILVSFMLKSMRAGSNDDDKSLAGGVYQDMFYDEVAKVAGRSNALGLGDKLFTQLRQLEKSKASGKSTASVMEALKKAAGSAE